jgi:hypothetical protein
LVSVPETPVNDAPGDVGLVGSALLVKVMMNEFNRAES